jgi:hypothetical protein
VIRRHHPIGVALLSAVAAFALLNPAVALAHTRHRSITTRPRHVHSTRPRHVHSVPRLVRRSSAGGTESVSWSVLGLPSGVVITQANESQTETIPVPSGLRAVALTGVLHAPIGFGSGYLEVDSANGVYLGSVRLPAAAGRRPVVHFRIPLTGVAAQDGNLTIALVVRQASNGPGRCGPSAELALTQLATSFTGRPTTPTTIDAFFPPVLRRVTLYTDPDPSPAEQQAVLQLTAELVNHYAPLPLRVDVEPLPATGPPSIPSGLLDRSVVIRQQAPAGISVIASARRSGTVLELTGSAAQLPVQVSLFAARLAALAQVPSAVITQAASAPRLNTASVYTFSQLGITGSTTVLGQGSLSIGLDQGLLGGPLDSIAVQLFAGYTPVVAPAQGTLTISNGSIVLDAVRLGPSGHLDTTFQIPRPLLTRKVGLQLALDYSSGIACAPLTPPLSFSIDPRSTVSVTHLTSAAGAFSALPTAFLGGFDVALQDESIDQLRDATLTVAGMQALTAAPLLPEVVSLGQIRTAGLGSLIVADSATVARLGLDPPLQGSGAQIAAEVPGPLRATVADGVGSIQAFADTAHNRTVLLVSTTGSWSLVSPLFTTLADSGWGNLDGDVYVAGEAAHPTDLTIRDSGTVFFAPQTSHGWVIWFVLAGIVLVALLAAAFVLRRRGHTPTGHGDGNH